jgi:hypothetical protein
MSVRVFSVIPWAAAVGAMVLLLSAGALAAQEQGAKHPLPAGPAPAFMSLAVQPLTGPEAGRASQIVLIRGDTTYLPSETLHQIMQLAGWERRQLGPGERYTIADMHPRSVFGAQMPRHDHCRPRLQDGPVSAVEEHLWDQEVQGLIQ